MGLRIRLKRKARPVTVSYTHLDVYKRQMRGSTSVYYVINSGLDTVRAAGGFEKSLANESKSHVHHRITFWIPLERSINT